MDCSRPGFPVLHCLLEFAQNHVHGVSDVIRPSHSLSPPFPPALYLSQQHGLFQWVDSSHQVAASASVLLMHIQDWFPLGFIGLISLLPKGLSRVFSSSTFGKHKFFRAQPSWFNSHIRTWLLEKPYTVLYISVPISQFIPPPFLPLVSIHFFSICCLHFCFANRFMCTIFLYSIYTH